MGSSFPLCARRCQAWVSPRGSAWPVRGGTAQLGAERSPVLRTGLGMEGWLGELGVSKHQGSVDGRAKSI